MARRKELIPDYGTVIVGGRTVYRTRILDNDGKQVALQAPTKEELHEKVKAARLQIEKLGLRPSCPTVEEYATKWLKMQSVSIRKTTFIGYESAIRTHIIPPLGKKRLSEVRPDDIKMAMVPLAEGSHAVYRSVHMLMKAIFTSAEENNYIAKNPCRNVPANGGIPAKPRQPLTDEQADLLLRTIRGLPPYTFVMLGLYTGMRREEILALQWDCVFLDAPAPYLTVQRAWHSENNRPIILTELKTKAARRNIPLPEPLIVCLRAEKKKSHSDYVVADSEGEPLSYTKFQRLWTHIKTRTVEERVYNRYKNGVKTRHVVKPVLGEEAANNPGVFYCLDFHVTPHMLRHTYITNLINSGVDPKTVQYLAGHENSKITMDIYAKVKYNRPDELLPIVNKAFGV